MEFLKNQDMLMDIIDKTDIISKMKVGFWVIEYPEEGQPRMYGDPMMHLIMGNDILTICYRVPLKYCLRTSETLAKAGVGNLFCSRIQ